MSETQGFEALQSLSSNPDVAPAEPKIDALGRAYATGKRKNAIAKVWIKPGRHDQSAATKSISRVPCCA